MTDSPGRQELQQRIAALESRVAELLQQHENLRACANQFQQLADNIQEVFWVGAPDWSEVYYISPAYETVWGRTRQSLYEAPLSWQDAIHEDDIERVVDTISRVDFQGSTVVTFPEYRIVRPDKSVRRIFARGFPVCDEKGRVYRVAGIAEDITRRSEIEKEISMLRGILPFCLFCKRIRNDTGYWEQVDIYIRKHYQADISHGVCPECMIKHYPEIDEDSEF